MNLSRTVVRERGVGSAFRFASSLLFGIGAAPQASMRGRYPGSTRHWAIRYARPSGVRCKHMSRFCGGDGFPLKSILMTDIATRLQHVRARLRSAELAAGRPEGAVSLLAVSKTQTATCLRAAFAAGQRAFAENYLQEALVKQEELHDLALEWHFIGPLQSNKTRPVAEHFAWVHSVDRAKLAERLGAQRPAHLPPLNICLQINLDDEASKSGCTLVELSALARSVMAQPRLCLRGLMCIPRPGNSAAFGQLAQTRADLLASIAGLDAGQFDTLSMGMSADLEAAVAAGSTLVRIGTAIFGERG